MKLKNIDNGKVITFQKLQSNEVIQARMYDNAYNELNGIDGVEISIVLDNNFEIDINNANYPKFKRRYCLQTLINKYPGFETCPDEDRVWLHELRPYRLIITNELAYKALAAVEVEADEYHNLGLLINYIKSQLTVPRYRGEKYSTMYLEEFIDMPEYGMTGAQILAYLQTFGSDLIVEPFEIPAT